LRKKYEEAVYQLFTDFREAYISVRRDVLYTIIIQFVIHVKPVRLNKRV